MKETRSRLYVVPCTQRKAFAYIAEHHRHHRPPAGTIMNLAVVDESGLVRGVATASRPVSRFLDDGSTLEVSRVATDGCPNACSALYGAIARAARALGYTSAITYTLPSEGGASLRGAGWNCDGSAGGGSWDKPSRRRVDKAPTSVKTRWRKQLAGSAPTIRWPECLGEDLRQLKLID